MNYGYPLRLILALLVLNAVCSVQEHSYDSDSQLVQDNMNLIRLLNLRSFNNWARREQSYTKRGIGACINRCLRVGQLNFIRCKVMCEW